MRILGLDPGSRVTGIGIIEGKRLIHAESLVLGGGEMPPRLGRIFQHLSDVIATYRPEVAAVETVFVNRNAQAAIKLGQARGVAVCAAVCAGLDVYEYAPREIKQSLVGTGAAAKQQVQHMVKMLLGLREDLPEDAADAVAVAICHQHTAETNRRLPAGVRL